MTRRGFALLLVLAATLIILTGTTLAMSLLMDTRQRLAGSTDDDHLVDGLAAGERMTIAWVRARASQIVMPPEGGDIPLIHERWRSHQGDGELTVHLYDACAMIPARCAGSTGSLRSALPPSWSGVAMPDLPPLQQREPPDWLETVLLPHDMRRFPRLAAPPQAVDWSTRGTIADGQPPLAPLPPEIGLAMLVSPHSQGAINVNTAPEELLRLAFHESGTNGFQALVQRRRRGAFTPSAPDQTILSLGFHFITVSPVWHAHISVTWNGAQRSWWVVLAGNSTDWRIVQRHDADR